MALFRPKYPDPKTGERIQSKVWWFEFIYDGKRICKSAKSTRKTVARAAENEYRHKLERARAGLPSEPSAQRIKTVSEVLKSYSNGYSVNKRPKSVLVVDNRGSHIKRLFGSLLLPDVTDEKVVEYQTARLEEGAGNRRHTFCTKLAEARVPHSTMLAMMRHMSAKMLRRYSHIRAKARRDAIAAIEARDSDGVPQESPKVDAQGPTESLVTH